MKLSQIIKNFISGIISIIFLLVLIFIQIYVFTINSPQATTKHYNSTNINIEGLKERSVRYKKNIISFTEHVIPKKMLNIKHKCYPIFIFHDFFLGSRNFINPKENKFIKKILQSKFPSNRKGENININGKKCIRIIRIDNPGFGKTKINRKEHSVEKFIKNEFKTLLEKFFLKNNEYSSFSVISHGSGAVYAFMLSSIKEIGKKIDNIVTINALHNLKSDKDKILTSIQPKLCWNNRLFYKISNFFTKNLNLPHFDWFSFPIQLYSKFNFMTYSSDWKYFSIYGSCFSENERERLWGKEHDDDHKHKHKKQKKNDDDDDDDNDNDVEDAEKELKREEREQFLSIYNNTNIDMFKQGLNGFINELNYFFNINNNQENWEKVINFPQILKNIRNKIFMFQDTKSSISHLEMSKKFKSQLLHNSNSNSNENKIEIITKEIGSNFFSSLEFIEPSMNKIIENIPKKKPIIIIGSGLAGLSATIESLENYDGEVYLIEKEKKIGGNSQKASSGISACCQTNGQLIRKKKYPKEEIDTIEDFTNDTLKSGKGLSKKKLINTLTQNSKKAIQFLEDKGINLDLLSKCGGHSHPRTHRSKIDPNSKPINVGLNIIRKLFSYIQKHNNLNGKYYGRLKLFLNTEMTQILKKNNNNDDDFSIVGVKVFDKIKKKSFELKGKAVILTTGGYAADRNGILKQYVPNKSHLGTTNGQFAKGQGIKCVLDLFKNKNSKFDKNRVLIHMDQVQVHPTCFVNPKKVEAKTHILAGEMLRGLGGILLDRKGKRFVNELQTRDFVTSEIFKNCKGGKKDMKNEKSPDSISYLLLNKKSAEEFNERLLSFYLKFGLGRKFESMKDVCESENTTIDCEILNSTLLEYNKAAKEGKDKFGKTYFPNTPFNDLDKKERVYLFQITPCLHYSMGGLRFNEKTQVLLKDKNKENEKPIKGLFAAGEVTGGLHGGNRLAGNSLLGCVVFGRISGQQAHKN